MEKVYKGSRFFNSSFVCIVLLNLCIFYLEWFTNVEIKNHFTLWFIFNLLFYFMLGSSLNTFTILNDAIIINNYWFFWRDTKIYLNEICEIKFVGEIRIGSIMLIMTKNGKQGFSCTNISLSERGEMIEFLQSKKVKIVEPQGW